MDIKKVCIFTLLIAFAINASADLPSLKSGEIIFKSKDISNAPWPEAQLFTVLENISPKEAAAIFSNYQDQKDYIPNLLKAKVVKVVAPNDIHVSFVMGNPWPISNEKYTTGNVLSHEGESYSIAWYLVKSESLIDTKGKVSFSPYANGKTLMSYRSFVYPKSRLAFLASPFIKSKVVDSVTSIAKFLQSFRAKHPEKLKNLVSKLEQALGNSNTN